VAAPASTSWSPPQFHLSGHHRHVGRGRACERRAALLIEHDPTIDEAALRDILTSSAKNLGPPAATTSSAGAGRSLPALMALDLKNEVARNPAKPPAALPAW